MLFVFLRIILNGCMVCRYVYKAKLKPPLYSFPFLSFISFSVQETALPLRPVPLSITSCQDVPDQVSLPLGAGCAAASPYNSYSPLFAWPIPTHIPGLRLSVIVPGSLPDPPDCLIILCFKG